MFASEYEKPLFECDADKPQIEPLYAELPTYSTRVRYTLSGFQPLS